MWANIVKQGAAPAAPAQEQLRSAEGLRVCVIDANAIINGIRLDGALLVCTPDVISEVRDKKARQFLASLKIEVAEPTEESVKAGARGQVHDLVCKIKPRRSVPVNATDAAKR
jgi:hypothetical protein